MLITMHSWAVFVKDICDAALEFDQNYLFRKHYTDYRLLVECAFDAVYLWDRSLNIVIFIELLTLGPHLLPV